MVGDLFGGLGNIRKEIQDKVTDIKREVSGKVDTINFRLDKMLYSMRPESREQYEITFPCSICGKPLTMHPNGKMHNEMRGIIKEGCWAHSDCISHKKTHW